MKKRVLSVILSIVLLASLIFTAAPAMAVGTAMESVDVTTPVNINGIAESISANVSYEKQAQPDISFITDTYSFDNVTNAYIIDSAINTFPGKLTTVDGISKLEFTLTNDKGMLLNSGVFPVSTNWNVVTGLVLGFNLITVTATFDNVQTITTSLTLFNSCEQNMSSLGLDLNDSDNDKLNNYLETYYGTDQNNPDTDGDGLTDYDEIFTFGTDPLNPDSNGNGLLDGDEDADKDGLANKDEAYYHGNPLIADTDGDGLNDGDEVKYGTLVDNPDTDGDGVNDYLEIKLGTDPLKKDSNGNGIPDGEEAFNYSVTLNDPSYSEPTIAVDAQAQYLDSLSISRIDAGYGFLSASVPGFINCGYDLKMNGSFDTAKLSFEIDSSLFNDPNFHPAIYYFDTNAQTLNKLSGQTLSGHTISVPLQHFSQYIVLNETEYDDSWTDADKNIELNGVDSDGDGICDSIENKGIKMGNGIVFYTLANNADTDGDGLKDGEEVSIVQDKNTGYWYGKLISDPTKKDSDGDGINDYDEVKLYHTSPLWTNIQTSDFTKLIDAARDQFTSSIYRNAYDDNKISINAAAALTGNWNYTYLYKEMLISFLQNNGNNLTNLRLEQEYDSYINQMVNWIGSIRYNLSNLKTTDSNVSSLIGEINSDYSAAQALQNKSSKTLSDVTTVLGQVQKLNSDLSSELAPTVGLQESDLSIFSSSTNSCLNLLSATSGIINDANDILDLYAKINANSQVVRDNLYILEDIVNYSSDSHLVKAAKELYVQSVLGVGDNIYSARDILINLGFNVTKAALALIPLGVPEYVSFLKSEADTAFNLPGQIAMSLRYLGCGELANSLSDDLRLNYSDGNFNGTYVSISNEGIYRFNVLALLRQNAESAWFDAKSYLSNIGNISNMLQKYYSNQPFLNGLFGKYLFTAYDFSSSLRQGVFGYNSSGDQVTVTAFRAGSSTVVDVEKVDNNGYFYLSLSPLGMGMGIYDITVSKPGYQSTTISSLNITQTNPLVNIGNITLAPLSDQPDSEYASNDTVTGDFFYAGIYQDLKLLHFMGLTSIPGAVSIFVQIGSVPTKLSSDTVFPVDGGSYEGVVDLSPLLSSPSGNYEIKVSVSLDGGSFATIITPDMYLSNVAGKLVFEESDRLENNVSILSSFEQQAPNNFLSTADHDITQSNSDIRVANSELTVLRNKALQICNDANAKTDYEKCYAIYSWVTSTIAYDTDSLAAYNSGALDPNTQKPYVVYTTQKAVCQGYAELIEAMLRSINIPCEFVRGAGSNNLWSIKDYAINHAWDYAYIQDINGNRWISLDATFGAGYVIKGGSKQKGTAFLPYNGYEYTDFFFDQTDLALSSTHYIVNFGLLTGAATGSLTSGNIMAAPLTSTTDPVVIYTDKADYYTGDKVGITVSVRNDNGFEMSNANIAVALPSSLKLVSGTLDTQIGNINSSETKTVQLEAEVVGEVSPTVESVTVDPSSVSVQKGATQQFNVSVGTQGGASEAVKWSVNSTSGSSIDNNGLLRISTNETAGVLTVKAVSVYDNTKFDTATVTVTSLQVLPTITATHGSGGAVSGGGVYEDGATVMLIATPDTNYDFDGWYENGVKIPDANSRYSFTATVDRTLEARFTYVGNVDSTPTVVSATPTAYVTKLNGNKNDLTITVTERLSDGNTNIITGTFRIDNNAAGAYKVGSYKVYVDTKGNTQIRDCHIVD